MNSSRSGTSRRRILSDKHFGEWQKRGKVKNVEDWQIGRANSCKKKSNGGRGRKRKERSKPEEEEEVAGRVGGVEVRNVTRDVRRERVARGVPPMPGSRSPFFPIRPLLHLRCAKAPLASKRDLVNGIRPVVRPVPSATVRDQRESGAAHGPVATNKQSLSELLAVAFA